MDVVIVESPAKAKTISKYLGGGTKVLASFGHIRDLPAKDGSVRPDEDFAMDWEVSGKAKKRLSEITQAVKQADRLLLATDPDREGEAISWHVLDYLSKKRGILNGKEIGRVAFNAVTKNAVQKAVREPREINMELVEAYLARRVLDYLVGFTLSPILWRKLPGARSAGRVQSVALRLIVEREMAIENFTAREYWTITTQHESEGKEKFEARLFALDGKKLGKFDLPNEEVAKEAVARITAGNYKIGKVEAKPVKRNPPPPFTTSTLQQDASRKLGMGASHTMRIAQKLYEGVDIGGETVGLITYMRTDGVQTAPEAIQAQRKQIGAEFGDSYLPGKPRHYASKAKNAQEAHEAIRPTDISRHPNSIKLPKEEARLYDLIWKRSIAAQMEAARFERTTIDIVDETGNLTLRATGQVQKFDGFLRVYQEGREEEQGAEGGDRLLPDLKEGDSVSLEKTTPNQHFTEPPPRCSEASLVKKMEELGIGRPSTYASILTVLQDRSYVRLEKKRFYPEDKGRLVTAFLENFFSRYVEYDFTAELETQLDNISSGELAWKQMLNQFWSDFSKSADDIADLRVTQVLDALNESLGPHIFPAKEDGSDPRACPSCDEGRLSLKVGRYGAFIGCSNYPDCKFTRQLGKDAASQASATAPDEPLGQAPEAGEDVYLKTGRFGPFVQRGEGKEAKRSSLPKGWRRDDITLEKALQLLSLPREIGPHPEDQEVITAGLGRYGPFVKHGNIYANLPDVEEVFSIGINRAVALIADKKNSKSGGRANGAKVLKDLGNHPDEGDKIQVLDGRYGPYVKYKRVNATIPKNEKPEEITLERAIELIEAKKSKKAGGKKRAKK